MTAEISEDTVARFAADLRRLRLEADSPTLARLQSQTGISRTVLSDALSGKQLPSARTVDGIVRACGGEPSEWVDRRDTLAGHRVSTKTAAVAAAAPVTASAPVVPTVTRAVAFWIAVAAFSAGVLSCVAAVTLLSLR